MEQHAGTGVEHREEPRDQVVEVAVSLCWHGLARLARPVPGHDR